MKKQLLIFSLLILNAAIINSAEKKVEEQKVLEDLYNCDIYASSEENRQIIKKSIESNLKISKIHESSLSNNQNNEKTFQVTYFEIDYATAIAIKSILKESNSASFYFRFTLAKNVKLTSWQLFRCQISNLNNENVQIIKKALEKNKVGFQESSDTIDIFDVTHSQMYDIDDNLKKLAQSKKNFIYNLRFFPTVDALEYLNRIGI